MQIVILVKKFILSSECDKKQNWGVNKLGLVCPGPADLIIMAQI